MNLDHREEFNTEYLRKLIAGGATDAYRVRISRKDVATHFSQVMSNKITARDYVSNFEKTKEFDAEIYRLTGSDLSEAELIWSSFWENRCLWCNDRTRDGQNYCDTVLCEREAKEFNKQVQRD